MLHGTITLLHSPMLQIKEVYDLLSLNYVEDDEAAFRFKYSAEFLEWYTSCFIRKRRSNAIPGPSNHRVLLKNGTLALESLRIKN